MKKIAICFLLSIVFLLAGCTLHLPYLDNDHYYAYRVIFQVEPDDAEILLDGRYIGEAYEFSSLRTALKLTTKNHEIVVKKRGYVEEPVNLYDYSSREMTVRLVLRKDKDPRTVKEKEKKEVPKPEYTPKTEKEKEPVMTPELDEPAGVYVDITLEINPPESSIYLNGKFWGIVPESGKIKNMRLKPGEYTLEIVKPGFKPYKKLLDVEKSAISLSINLQKE